MGRDGFRFFSWQARKDFVGGENCFLASAVGFSLVTASIEKKWLSGWSAAATFEGEFSDVTRSYAGKGVVRYAW
jgi:hypothetical protein